MWLRPSHNRESNPRPPESRRPAVNCALTQQHCGSKKICDKNVSRMHRRWKIIASQRISVYSRQLERACRSRHAAAAYGEQLNNARPQPSCVASQVVGVQLIQIKPVSTSRLMPALWCGDKAAELVLGGTLGSEAVIFPSASSTGPPAGFSCWMSTAAFRFILLATHKTIPERTTMWLSSRYTCLCWIFLFQKLCRAKKSTVLLLKANYIQDSWLSDVTEKLDSRVRKSGSCTQNVFISILFYFSGD